MKKGVEERHEIRLITKDISLIDDAAMEKLELGFREYLKRQKAKLHGRVLVESMPGIDLAEKAFFRTLVFTDTGEYAFLMCAAKGLFPDGMVSIASSRPELLTSWHEMELGEEEGS